MSEDAPLPSVEPTDIAAPATSPSPPPIPEVDKAKIIQAQIAALMRAGDNGAKWFFWVAGFSLVNSALMLSKAGMFFVVGLGTTLVADSIADAVAHDKPELALAAKAFTIAFDIIIASILCLFGWLARKRILPVFAIGMALYLLDGLIYLMLQDWMSVAFHGFALYSMWQGFTAFRKINAIQRQLQQPR